MNVLSVILLAPSAPTRAQVDALPVQATRCSITDPAKLVQATSTIKMELAKVSICLYSLLMAIDCPNSCSTCTSATTCTSCAASHPYFEAVTGVCHSVCPSGYYASGSQCLGMFV